MIIQNKTSGDQIVYKSDVIKNVEPIEHVEPVKDVDLDALLNEINQSEPQVGNLVKVSEEKKSLSILKKVDGVIDYYQQIKKDKVKNSIPKYLFDLTLDILYFKRCQRFSSNSFICHVRLPLIVISNKYFSNFIYF